MFVWLNPDPLDTDQEQQDLIDFCGTQGVNTLFLDIWSYLGGSNWSNANRDRMKQFLGVAQASGIRVYALAGNVDWGQNHAWVMKNIVQPVINFNAMTGAAFDGFILDVEYWTNETSYPPADHLPGLLDLVKAIQKTSALPVGLFSAFYLKDNTSTRSNVSYAGKSAQDGEHMIDVADFVVVGAYRDDADDQEDLFDPWYDYAKGEGRNCGLYCGSETIDITPANITYHGATKAAMETEHTQISNTYSKTTDAVFLGQAVHNYDAWDDMT